MIFLDFMGRRPLKVKEHVISVTKVSCSKINCQKSGDTKFGKIKAKNWFLPHTIHRSSSVKHGLLGTVLYLNPIVTGHQGSAVHDVPNY